MYVEIPRFGCTGVSPVSPVCGEAGPPTREHSPAWRGPAAQPPRTHYQQEDHGDVPDQDGLQGRGPGHPRTRGEVPQAEPREDRMMHIQTVRATFERSTRGDPDRKVISRSSSTASSARTSIGTSEMRFLAFVGRCRAAVRSVVRSSSRRFPRRIAGTDFAPRA
jgi:hypothetical protein